MLAKDIREMNEGDINAKIAELERERFNLRVRGGTQTLEDPLRLRVIRKEIARLNTVLREKIIGIAEAKGPAMTPARRVTGRRGRKRATAVSRSKKRA
jgi:large subunit ribosomal protein L29